MIGITDKHCWYEFSSNVPECFLRLENEVKAFPFFAFIHHFPGSTDPDRKEHVHFVIRTNPITLKALSNKLDLPEQYIRWVRITRSMIRYLVHYDNPEKEQYDREAIITSDRNYVENCFSDIKTCSPLSEYYNYCEVLNGRMSVNSYLENNSLLIASLSFSSRIKLYNTLYFADKENRIERGIM